MLNSAILDVAIGLVFVFLSVSLATSAAVEAIASVLKWRSTTLVAGVQDLLNDPNFTGLAARLYAHALINPRGPGFTPAIAAAAGGPAAALAPASTVGLKKKQPAYIDPKQFASALMDVLALPQKIAGALPTAAQLHVAVDTAVPANVNPQVNQVLNGIVARADGDLDKVHAALCAWFDNAMDRVSGAYKRYSQIWAFGLALVISIVMNADSLHVAQRIWAQPTIVSSFKAGSTAQATVEQSEALPLGWPAGFLTFQTAGGAPAPESGGALVSAALGWFITALASLFGAPFWFDTLQQFVRLKGAGPSPAEKADKSAASA